MPIARVKLTPKVQERLMAGDTVKFRIPTGIDELWVTLEDEDGFLEFDRIFEGLWQKLLRRFEKSVSASLK
jgi:hypothetical protein